MGNGRKISQSVELRRGETTTNVLLGRTVTIESIPLAQPGFISVFNVAVELQGDHSIHPPAEDIKTLVLSWLRVNLAEYSVSSNFTLQVDRRRIPTTREFIGVRALCIPEYNLNCIELRVRPKGSQHQWKCHLSSDDRRLVWALIQKARPQASKFVQDVIIRFQKDPNVGKRLFNALANFGLAKVEQAKQRRLETVKRRLLRGHLERRLCHNLVQEQGAITSSVLWGHITDVYPSAIEDDLRTDIVSSLVENGLLEPRQTTSLIFEVSIKVEEGAEEYLQIQEGQRREQILAQQAAAFQLYEAAKREEKRLEERLTQARDDTAQLYDRYLTIGVILSEDEI